MEGESVPNPHQENRDATVQRRERKDATQDTKIAAFGRNLECKWACHGNPSSCFQKNTKTFNFHNRTSKDRVCSQKELVYHCS